MHTQTTHSLLIYTHICKMETQQKQQQQQQIYKQTNGI